MTSVVPVRAGIFLATIAACLVLSVAQESKDRPCNNPNNPECPVTTNPSCTVVENNDYTYSLQRPSLTKDVAGPLQLHFQRHYSSYPTYDLPLTFLWDSLAIKDLMEDAKMSCCDKDIHFTRYVKFPMLADFSWTGNPVTVSSKPNPILSGFKIQIKIPSKLSGIAVVGGGFSEFHFDDGKMPHLTIINSNSKQIFDADLHCLKTSATSVVAKPIEPSGTQLNPDLFIYP